MNPCCMSSFAWKGIRERFRLAAEGETHTCPTCGQVFQLTDGTWKAIEEKAPDALPRS